MVVLIVPIQLKPEFKDKFIEGITGHARTTLSKEPGCLRFDVVQDGSDTNRIWLYEVYKDETARQEHANSPHMIKWKSGPAKEWREEGPPGARAGSHIIWSGDLDSE